MVGKIKDLTGKIFDDLTCISLDRVDNKISYWNCKCSCGNLITRGRDYLSRKKFKSCGCKDSKGKLWNTKRREYTIYHSMRGRCTSTDKTTKMYRNYVAKGITVCDRWVESFANFFEDMGECPDGFTLERVDNSKGYSKDNCVWECRQIQEVNKDKLVGCTSIYRGVSYIESEKVFRAYVKLQQKQIHIGRYKTEMEAAIARDSYILTIEDFCVKMGEKRLKNYLNFPEEFEEEICQYFTTQC